MSDERRAREILPPPALNAPHGTIGWLVFGLRLAADVRVGSIYRLARTALPRWSGTVLDVGCGDGPWAWLLPATTKYIGLDVPRADAGFGYKPHRGRQVAYDGLNFPFADGSFTHVLCTEVLEHVEQPEVFLRECCRVIRRGGTCFFSVPFAARYHYVPYDHWRFTPASLERLFARAGWTGIGIVPLGTDVTVAMYKANALILKLALGRRAMPWRLLSGAVALLLSPLFCLLTAVELASALWHWGDDTDTLGYVVIAENEKG